jgi:hypothetical protein
MNKNYDPFNVSHAGFDPHQEPRLPLGNWNLSALAAHRNGGSTFGLPDAGEVLPEVEQNPEMENQPPWDPPKFEEPRTFPKGWDVSSLK